MPVSDAWDWLKPGPDRVGDAPVGRGDVAFVGLVTADSTANTFCKVKPLSFSGAEVVGTAVGIRTIESERVAANLCGAVTGDYVLVQRVRHRYVALTVVGNTSDSGGIKAARCRCKEEPYELTGLECGRCIKYYKTDPCSGALIEVPNVMPRIYIFKVVSATGAAASHVGDEIKLYNVEDSYGAPTCVWKGKGPHCQNLELSVGSTISALSYIGKSGSGITVLLTVDAQHFTCCGNTPAWTGTDGDTETITGNLYPDPCTCCAPSPNPVTDKCIECSIPENSLYARFDYIHSNGAAPPVCITTSVCVEGVYHNDGSGIRWAFGSYFTLKCDTSVGSPTEGKIILAVSHTLSNCRALKMAEQCNHPFGYAEFTEDTCDVIGPSVTPTWIQCGSPFAASFVLPACTWSWICKEFDGTPYGSGSWTDPETVVSISEEPCP